MPSTSHQLDRRHEDTRIAMLQRDVEEMKETVKQMHDMLTSFRTLAALAKWVTTIAGSIAAMAGGYHILRH